MTATPTKPMLPDDIIEQVRRGESVTFPAFFDPAKVQLPEGFYFATITSGGRVKEFWLLHMPGTSE